MKQQVKIPLRRYGGKVRLAKWIVSGFPEHKTYIEPFCGSAAVFFAKEPCHSEILNDIDDRIIKAFEMIRSRPKELAALLWATPYAQSNWREQVNPSELEKSALFIASTQQFYAGNTKSSSFSSGSAAQNKSKAKVWADWFMRVLPAAARLKDAQITNKDALSLIERYSHLKDCLWYVDPPYVGHEHEYKNSVKHAELAKALNHVQGKVIVSGTNAEEDHFKGWNQHKKLYTATAGSNRRAFTKRYEECLYCNFKTGFK